MLQEASLSKPLFNKKVVRGIWNDNENYYLRIIQEPWYKTLVDLDNIISYYSYIFFQNKGLKILHLPITTGSISSPMGLGSDSIPVKVNLCGIDTYLADSMQFLLEYGCRFNPKGSYYIMPSFRGEAADERHLCQFLHCEAEIEGNLDDIILLVEEYVKFLCKSILDNMEGQLLEQVGSIGHIVKVANMYGNFKRIPFQQALVSLIEDNYTDTEKAIIRHPAGFEIITSYGEKRLIDIFDGIVWVTNYDHLSVPFYQAFDQNDIHKAMNADLLFGIGEVVGLGQRHENYFEVQKALRMHQVSEKEYLWYSNLKKQYPMKTSGFGMGIERFILWILKHDDIRDCQLLPRFNGINFLP